MLANYSHGQGKTLVLIHGFCANNTCFNRQVLLLKSHFHVVTIDLPGFGSSPAITNPSIEKMADLVYETLCGIGINSCVMLGHSMGGYVTLAFAKKYADILSGFGLIHSTAAADNDERKQKRDQAISFINQHGAVPYVESFIPPLFLNQELSADAISTLISEGKRIEVMGLTGALESMKTRENSFELLKTTTLPALFIAGKNDLLIPAANVAEQAAMCNKAMFALLENSAHMGMIEEAEKTAAVIHSFMLLCK